MPELPEVEVTRQGITPYLVDQTVVDLVVRNASLRWPVPELAKTDHRPNHTPSAPPC